MTASFFLLQPPAAYYWQIITDGTERGGESVGFVSEIAATNEANSHPGLLFQGSLGGIPGSDGLVGFALMRAAWLSAPTETAGHAGVRLRLSEASDDLNYILLLRMGEFQIPGIPGQVTYQKVFTGNEPEVVAKWTDFHAVVRGRALTPGVAPSLDPSKITDWAVQITRSGQSAANRAQVPLAFRIGLQR